MPKGVMGSIPQHHSPAGKLEPNNGEVSPPSVRTTIEKNDYLRCSKWEIFQSSDTINSSNQSNITGKNLEFSSSSIFLYLTPLP